MEFPSEQIEELQRLYGELRQVEEGGVLYIYIPALPLPEGCEPKVVKSLLCPSGRDNYTSRLFFSKIISTPHSRNWNAKGIRIMEQQWYAFSYQHIQGMSLLNMLASHLRGLKVNK